MRLTLLSRAYCHLCDEMLVAVQPMAKVHGASIDVIDVDAPGNAALAAAWGDKVPALFAGAPDGGELLCHYHFDPARVEAVFRADGARG